MATATFQVYGLALQNILKADIDFDTVVFKAALAATAYTPNMDTHDFLDDVVANEVTGTNWAAGGQNTNATITVDATSNEVRVALSDISVNTVTLTDGKHVIVYNSTPGTNATRHLIGYGTFDTALAPTAGTLAIDFPSPTFKFTY
jgi:hypothetical protein